jgi:hypothetical protein
MHSPAENFYAIWRTSCRTLALRDGDAAPPEKLLQAVWQHQRLHRDRLKTTDGRSVRVLHPGFISVEGGPDFRGAVLQFGEEKPVAGDVEVDLQSSGWRAHGHDKNPGFKNVILHVVWEASGKIETIPSVLALKDFLDATLPELALALENESGLPAALRGKCSAPLRDLAEPQLTSLLHAAARVRFENKANAMLAHAKHAGWEQTLWENLFRALGYKNNVWPMLRLAETRPAWQRGTESVFAIQTRLLGVSGLLPAELTRAQKSSDTFLRHAWDLWWREQDELEDYILPRTVWKFHGLRPANHPQRRLALAAHWLAAENLAGKLEDWVVKNHSAPLTPLGRGEGQKLLRSLHEIFQVERDEFWSWHWTFNSARMAKPQPLLGETRVTDLAVNVVLPWLWIRAREGGNGKIQREVERRFLAWPAAENNSVLKLARQRLLGTAIRRSSQILSSAAHQQGLMQIVRDFCEHSNAVCADCWFPELVHSFKSSAHRESGSAAD